MAEEAGAKTASYQFGSTKVKSAVGERLIIVLLLFVVIIANLVPSKVWQLRV